jgi:DNA polymerase III subunit gamma/tau
MSYLVLARKYRPRRFAEMVGQEHVVQALGNALAQQRLHHAYLFTGTRGVGKTTVSRIFAKSVNCTGADGQGGITAEPCGVCASCRDIDAGRFVDYVELDAASNRGVDEISQLLDQSVYKPVLGRFKVYMIDEVHMLSTTAFNAMLKTLEEPPDYLKFILATTDPQKVPATVLSRCLQFNLRPMAPETVFEHLSGVMQAETIEAEPGALRLLARAARGSMRDALSLTDQAIAYGSGRVGEADVRQMLGSVDRAHVVALIDAVAANDGVSLIAAVETLRREGLSAAGTLEELALLAQRMAVLQAVPQAADPLDPETPLFQSLASKLPADETQLLYSVALHGRAELGLAPDEYSGLTMVLLRLLAFRPAGGGGTAAVTAPAATTPVPQARTTQTVAPAVLGQTPSPISAPISSPASSSSRELLRTPLKPIARVPVPSSGLAPSAPVAQPRPVVSSTRTSAGPAQSACTPPWDEDPPPEDPGPAGTSEGFAPSADALLVEEPEAATWAPDSPTTTPILTLPAGTAEMGCWVDTVQALLEKATVAGLVRELAWQAQCVAMTSNEHGQCWTLRTERASLRQPNHVERLQQALSELLGEPLELKIEAGTAEDSAAQRDAVAKAQAQQAAEAIIVNDPMVRRLLARFPGARIVPGSIRPVA